MSKLYEVARRFKSEGINEAIVMFSTGKDSIATLDICYKYLDKIEVVYLYFVNGLGYREEFIQYYENRYNIKVHRLPHPELSTYSRKQVFGCKKIDMPTVSLTENDNMLRREFNIPYIAYGYKKTDSLSRRGQIWHGDGIDQRNKKLFPVADFNEKDVFYYLQQHKLKLPVEYSYGYRDLNTFFEKDTLQWLIANYPDDYLKVKAQFPLIDAVLKKEA